MRAARRNGEAYCVLSTATWWNMPARSRPGESATRVLCFSSPFRSHRVASARQESGDGNVLIKVFPVQPEAREFDPLTFLARCLKQSAETMRAAPRRCGHRSVRSTSCVRRKRTAVGEMIMPMRSRRRLRNLELSSSPDR
jgi:hypothetical protein